MGWWKKQNSELIKTKCPQVHKHVESFSMPWELALSKWFMCIYSDVLPVETVLRIWDCLFYEGSKILIRVALTLVLQRQHQILMTDEFSKLVIEFKNCAADKTVVACHTFIPEVFRLSSPLPSKQVEKMRQGISIEVNKELSIQDEKRKEMKQRNETLSYQFFTNKFSILFCFFMWFARFQIYRVDFTTYKPEDFYLLTNHGNL